MKLLKIFFAAYLVIAVASCNEDEILKEVPLDFFSPENSFVKPDDFQSALNLCMSRTKALYGEVWGVGYGYIVGTDVYSAAVPQNESFDNYIIALEPAGNLTSILWNLCYDNISWANAILTRIEKVEYPSDAEKNVHIASARFLRAWNYRILAAFYGGVPLILGEVTSPKRDYVRATQAQVYDQIIGDAEFASQNLPNVNKVRDGELCNAAADQLLTEIYLTVGRNSDAIAAASKIINSGDFNLMTARFGSSKNDVPGDPYYDLFELNNQNRGGGNREGIWVLQSEPGNWGLGESGNYLSYVCDFEPFYWTIQDPDGVGGFIGGGTSQNGGTGIGYFKPTPYMSKQIWQSDWNNDLRNSPYNMIRDYLYDNPQSAYYGKSVAKNPPAAGLDTTRRFYPSPRKVATYGKFPDFTIADPQTGRLTEQILVTFSDWYVMRLAETYLLRAEAYLKEGNAQQAADDINKVRARANATPVSAAGVDINYILDERARELGVEEWRRITLSRMGLLYERVQKYFKPDGGTQNMQPHHILYPIPFSEIERNTEAVLEQNPGYN